MFNLYFTLILMLNSLEYLLPLCGVYRTVIISVDRWKIIVMKLARDFFFLTGQRLLGNWLFEKKIKKSIGGVVYIDLHNPESAVK